MADTETKVKQILQNMRSECKTSTEWRDAIELLVKITRNVIPPKENGTVDPKFRQINPANPEFNRKIWKSSNARKILLVSGWCRKGEGDNLRLVHSEELKNEEESDNISAQDLMKILIEHRNITPLENEGVQLAKPDNILTPEEKYRQDKLRGEAERKAAYEKFQKEKRDRQVLAEQLKREQKADQVYRSIRRPKTDQELGAITPGWEPERVRTRGEPMEEENEEGENKTKAGTNDQDVEESEEEQNQEGMENENQDQQESKDISDQ